MACNQTSLFFIAWIYSVVWIYHIVLIQSSVDGNLGCFNFLAIMSYYEQYFCEHSSPRFSYIFICLGYIPRSGILDPMVTMFNLSRNCQTIFRSTCLTVYYHQRCIRDPVSLYLHQHMLICFLFFNKSNLGSVKWHLIVVLISLMSKDVDWDGTGGGWPFVHFLFISMEILCLFLNYHWTVRILYITHKSLKRDTICKNFSLSLWVAFSFLTVSFETQMVLILMEFSIVIFLSSHVCI